MAIRTFAQLTFQLGNPGAPNTVYTSTHPADNNLTLQISTNTPTSFAAGAPVPLSSAPTAKGSLIYLNLSPLDLSAAEFAALAVSATDWAARSFPDTQTICLAPTQTIPLDIAPAAISVAIGNFAIANPPSSNPVSLTATYFHVDGLTYGGLGVPGAFGVLLQPPPDKDDLDLHDVLGFAVAETGVVCSIDGYAPVQNTLNLSFGPGNVTRAVTAGPNTAFEVSFVYADDAPGFGALTTPQHGTVFTFGRGGLMKAKKGGGLSPEPNAAADAWSISAGKNLQSPS